MKRAKGPPTRQREGAVRTKGPSPLEPGCPWTMKGGLPLEREWVWRMKGGRRLKPEGACRMKGPRRLTPGRVFRGCRCAAEARGGGKKMRLFLTEAAAAGDKTSPARRVFTPGKATACASHRVHGEIDPAMRVGKSGGCCQAAGDALRACAASAGGGLVPHAPGGRGVMGGRVRIRALRPATSFSRRRDGAVGRAER